MGGMSEVNLKAGVLHDCCGAEWVAAAGGPLPQGRYRRLAPWGAKRQKGLHRPHLVGQYVPQTIGRQQHQLVRIVAAHDGDLRQDGPTCQQRTISRQANSGQRISEAEWQSLLTLYNAPPRAR